MSQNYSAARFSYFQSESALKFDDDLSLSDELRDLSSVLFPLWIKRDLSLGNLRFVEKLNDTGFEFIFLSIDDDRYRGVVIVEKLSKKAAASVDGASHNEACPVEEGDNPKTVLVVDDNAAARMIIAGQLSKLKVAFDMAENGKVAVEKAEKKRYSLILMDISMPVMDGLEATEEIRKRLPEPDCHVPILALTAASLIEMNERIYASGMNGYLAKPVRQAELMQAIDPFINKSLIPVAGDTSSDLFSVTESIDLSYLKDVSRGDLEFAAEIINSFLETNSKLLADINYTLSVGEIKKCREYCHKIKPVFSYLGLRKVIPLMEEFHSGLQKPEINVRGELILLKQITGLAATATGDLREIHTKMLKKIA